jgi:hypothetical protein
MMLGCESFRRDFIYRSSRHYSQLRYLLFIFLIATTSLVRLLIALKTVPKAPSPRMQIILYFYINNQQTSPSLYS